MKSVLRYFFKNLRFNQDIELAKRVWPINGFNTSLTCLDAIFKCVLAVDKELVQVQRLFWYLQVDLLLHLVWVVEVEDLLLSVVGLGHVVQQDVHHAVQELTGVPVSCRKVLAHREQG